MTNTENLLDHTDCLSYSEVYPENCQGAVEYRMPLSGSLRSYPRCDQHWGERLDTQHRLVRDYGISFDPYAERYDDSDY